MPLSIVETPAILRRRHQPASLRLPHPLAQLEELRQALALSQQESMDARQQVELLMEANAKHNCPADSVAATDKIGGSRRKHWGRPIRQNSTELPGALVRTFVQTVNSSHW